MITLETKAFITGLTGREVFDFLADPDDRAYQRWWPGVHLALHRLSRADAQRHVGDVVYMDEYVRARRVRFEGIVTEAVPGRRLVWQLKAGVPLPVWLSLDLVDATDGVMVTHRIRPGWSGRRALLDRLFRLYFTPSFAASLDAHVRTELALLRGRLRPAGRGSARRQPASARSRSPEAPT